MSDTIAAISTPVAAGGIGVIRISGDDAIAVADKAFNATSGKKLSSLKGYTAVHGRVHLDGEDIDEGVALVFRAPKSYTGEDTVEISCHGGVYVTNQVLRAVLSAGARPAEAGEFTKRAFLNGKMSLSSCEGPPPRATGRGCRPARRSRRWNSLPRPQGSPRHRGWRSHGRDGARCRGRDRRRSPRRCA